MNNADKHSSGEGSSFQQSLVSISEASHILGVSETALRQWTDEGKIKAFVTPGGHRRYSRAELNKFMLSSRKLLGIKDVVAELEDTASTHREIGRTYFKTSYLYSNLNRESQELLAELGRRLLSIIIRYITEPSRREEIIKLAQDVGHSHGETLARLGFQLTDSVEAFLMHRNTIMEATSQLLTKKEAFNRRVVEAIPLTTRVMDETLVSLVAAHQEYQKVHHAINQSESKGGTAE